jgi:phosphate/sulfate permease
MEQQGLPVSISIIIAAAILGVMFAAGMVLLAVLSQ